MAASPRTSEPAERYLIALGSNRRHRRLGSPRNVLRAAIDALTEYGIIVEASSSIIMTPPLGHSLRRYANAAAILSSPLSPDALLTRLKSIEAEFGRRPGGRRWASRVIDLDIVLRDAGAWSSRGLTIPHVAFRQRLFVLIPATAIAANWRDPLTGLTLRHLRARLTRPRPLPRCSGR